MGNITPYVNTQCQAEPVQMSPIASMKTNRRRMQRMELKFQVVPDWPKLAWVARFEQGHEDMNILHGPMVEVGDDWVVEAVWSGDFAEGDFDRTNLVFGSGIRCRDDKVIFVSAGTMLDHLWHCKHEGRFCVSNSLPALLACEKLTLSDDYLDYAEDIFTMREGLNKYKRTIPTTSSDVHVLYYRNLVYDGRSLVEVDKPDATPDFNCYADYYGFLVETARRLKANLESPARKQKIVPLASVSSGYDSGAAAAIAREAGCEDAVTIVNSSSLLSRSDSGLEIAGHLGINCRTYRHTRKAYKHEEAIWAIAGRPAGLNLSVFHYPKPLCLFFTGYRGDSIWCRAILDWPAFSSYSIDGLGLCEHRLIEGVFHCPVPFWGASKVDQIQASSFLPEMKPWTLHRDHYDRPIPRRIMEDAGVPRELFGNRKEDTSAETFFRWPFIATSMHRFASFLKDRNIYSPSRPMVWVLRKITLFDHLVYVNVPRWFGGHKRALRFLLRLKGQSLLFQWANGELKKTYETPLEEEDRR